jgi:anaerobic selenocysteine-containing dehydrogenase
MPKPRVSAAGGFAAIAYTLKKGRESGGVFKLYKRMRSRNACKTCAYGMGGQRGGMVNEEGSFPEVCKKSLQAQAGDMQAPIEESFLRDHPLRELESWSSLQMEAAGRLVFPIGCRAGDTHFRRIGWDEALDLTASALKEAPRDEVFFYGSGRSSNEAAFLMQTLARAYGTANIHNCSYYCHQASGVALGRLIGSGTSTVVLDDLDKADLAIVAGANPSSNHPRLITKLVALRDRGGTVIVVNPVKELGLVRFRIPSQPGSLLFGSDVSDIYLQPHVGSDIAVYKALVKGIVERDDLGDLAFGLRSRPRRRRSRGPGHRSGQARRHALGDGAHPPRARRRERLRPRQRGARARDGASVRDPSRGQARYGHLSVHGGGARGADPRRRSARGEPVRIEPRPHLVGGGAPPDRNDLLHLDEAERRARPRPREIARRATGAGPRRGIPVHDPGEHVQLRAPLRRRRGTPPGDLRSEVEVVCALAARLLPSGPFASTTDHDTVRRAIAKVVPGYREIAGRTFHDARFPTPSGKARAAVVPLPAFEPKDGEFRLMTLRSEGQFNTVVYEDEDLYRGTTRRDVVMMSAADGARLGLREEDLVTVETEAGRMRVVVAFIDIPPGNVAMYYPEANAIVPRRIDPDSGTPAFKSVVARIERARV